MPVLEVKNLHCSFKVQAQRLLGKQRKKIIEGVSFSIHRADTVGILGESGSGKSTIARCIAGLLLPDNGHIFFNGLNIFPDTDNRKKIKRKIQMLFQNHTASLNPRMPVKQSLLEALNYQEVSSQIRGNNGTRIQEVLDSTGLSPDILKRYPRQLSGGQRQRVALARSLLARPELLILDEPTSALDILTQVQILRLIKKLQEEKGFSLLYITHDVASALEICDRIIVLYRGKIVEEAESSRLMNEPRHPYTKRLLNASGLLEPAK